MHIPATWRETTTVLKYAGRFTGVTHQGASVTATLQFYGRVGWQHHSNVAVALQRYAGSGEWRTVARTHSGSGGRVSIGGWRAGAPDRPVSGSTGGGWGGGARVGADPARGRGGRSAPPGA